MTYNVARYCQIFSDFFQYYPILYKIVKYGLIFFNNLQMAISPLSILSCFYSLLATCYLLLVTCHLLLDNCYLLHVTCYMLLAICYLLLSDTCNLILFHMILGYLKLAISCKKIASFRSCSATRSCF